MENNTTEFLKELKELLIKYEASLWVSLDGDTHGVDTNFIVEVKNKDTIINEYSSSLDVNAINNFLKKQ